MPSTDSSRDVLLQQLAEEFVERQRRGERPALSEYADRHPDLAADIRELFPALVKIEHLKPAAGDLTGGFVPESAPADGHTPERLGEYRILREVGSGGMGVVYEAEQESLGRHVALKVLPRQALLKATYLERFRREAKAAARLHHTNIVPVFGVGEADGTHFYAMQFIQGQSLDQVLHDVRRLRKRPGAAAGGAGPTETGLEGSVAQGLLTGQFAAPPAAAGSAGAPPALDPRAAGTAALPVAPPTAPLSFDRAAAGLSASGPEAQYFRSAARVGLQVAEALAYAHRQGVLHRDVKPSNLLLDAQGTVWVTDFGLAKAEGADELTHTGDVVGTVRFMAPERFDGRSLPQSDVYSLGLTLYEMLTLRPAFDDTNKARLIEKVLHDPAPPPRKLDPHVPRDLETIVLKCLAKDPAGRYATAEEMAEDLRRFLADRPIRARRASQAERVWRWCRRNPAVASLVGSVLGLLVVIAVGGVVMSLRLNDALGQAQGDRNKARGAERAARLREAEALVGQAHGTRYSRRPGQRFEALAALHKAAEIGHELGQPPEWFDRLRNEAIAALALPDVHITQTWDGYPPGTHRAEVSPDFELYARTTRQGACAVRRIADDTEVARLPELGEPAIADFGPGRLLLLYGETSGRCQLWDVAKPEPVLRLDERHRVDGWAFRLDGQLLALCHRDGFIGVYDTGSGKCRHYLAPKGGPNYPFACPHPTGPFVAVCGYYSNLLQVRDLRNGNVLVAHQLPWRGSAMCAWGPDGRTLAVSDGYSGLVHLYAFDPASPSLHLPRVLRGPSDGGTAVAFNPAGDRVATRGWGGVVHLFDPATGRLLFSTYALPKSSRASLQWGPSGGRLAAAQLGPRQEQMGVWSVADAREYRALVHDGPGRRGCYVPTVHSGGRLAVLGLTDGLALFDLETGRELAFVSAPGGGGSACFDGDGNLFTNSYAGLLRWPVRPDLTQRGRLTVGPPERLPFHPADRSVATSADGRVIAQASYQSGGWVLHPDAPRPRQVETVRCHWVSVSPDGRWVACGPHVERVNVYEAATGRRVWQSPIDRRAYSRFSPDGHWLVTDSDGGRAYRVGTWEPGRQLGPGTPWDVSPDSRLVVMGQADGVYRLVELATGRELARLEDPEQVIGAAVFTPDGTRLVVSAAGGLRVWDLRRLRAGLARLGLDWHALPYPEAAAASAPGPLEVKVVGALALATPRDPKGLNNLAWQLVTGPVDQRDPARALQLIQDALKQKPNEAHLLNTLGVVQYRNGQYAAAVVTLEKSLRAGKGESDDIDLFFLAMCHARLGAPDKAKDCFDRAVKWTEARKDLKAQHVEELKAFRAEAEAALRVP
jgi:serine/threonine protein kinase/WD40 repeat protein